MIIIFQALITFIIKDVFLNLTLYSFFLVFINFFVVSYYLFNAVKREWFILIYLGFVVRIIVMLIDLYVPSIEIFGSGSDTEYFHEASISIVNGLMPLSDGRTFYVTVLSGLYYLFGDQRLFAQFLNIVLWVFSAVFIYRSLILFEVQKKVVFLALSLFIFIPNGMFMSSILLRESIIIFFITFSLFHFLKWLKYKSTKDYVSALLLALVSMVFHTGMVGFLIGYIITFIFVGNEKSAKKKSNNFIFFMLIIAIAILLFYNDELFLTKFNSSEETGIKTINLNNYGESAYLQSFGTLSSWKVFLLTPLKMIYFLFSPLPTDWRGLGDVATFLFDSLLYIFLIVSITIGSMKSKMDKKLKIGVLIIVIICTFIFAYGTGNAGTAMRHRYKLLPLLLIAFGLFSGNRVRKHKKFEKK